MKKAATNRQTTRRGSRSPRSNNDRHDKKTDTHPYPYGNPVPDKAIHHELPLGTNHNYGAKHQRR